MYISQFRVRNYMIHQDTTIDLHPLTVLVGPNGGGKSALFDSMLNFSLLSRGNLRQAFGPYPYSFRASLHHGASNVARIGFEVTMSRTHGDADSLIYAIDYAQQGMAEDQPAFMIFNEKLTRMPGTTVLFDRSDADRYPLARSLRLENDRSLFSAVRLAVGAGSTAGIDPLLEYLTQQISRFNKFRVDPTALAAPNRLPELSGDKESAVGPRLGYHGEDLASTLYYLAETQAQALDVVRERVREVVPEFDDFDFNAVGTERIAFSIKYSDRRGAVPSVRLSSGMLNYLGLIVLVSTPNRPPVLMIEEAENGLTPQAVRSFYKAVRSLAFSEDDDQRSQVLISSHSPFIICEAWNGEDRNFIHQVKVADGCAVVHKFSDVVAELGTHLAKDKHGERSRLSLNHADAIMSGHLS